MSEYDRGKFYGKKKFQNQRQDTSNFNSRFFNSKSSFSNKSGSKESLAPEKVKIKQPTILLKSREHGEERPASPKRNAKDNDSTTQVSLAVSSSSEAHLSTKEMKKSVKFLEHGTIYIENVQDFVQENNDFLVVGVVGAQGVGKSTILNLLAQNEITESFKKSVFTDVKPNDTDEDDGVKILTENISNLKFTNEDKNSPIFQTQGLSDAKIDSNTTYGMDLFITNNRVILLDCQPFNSVAVLSELIQSENKRSNFVNELLPPENSGEIYGLQLTAFLMSVCHVLIVVQDWFFDSNILRFIQTAEMLKPTISSVEDEIVDHFPHIVLVHNRAQMEDFSPARFRIMQKVYKSIFNKTKLHLETGMGLGSGRIINCISPENCGDPINLFLIPEYNEQDENIYKGHPPLEDLVKHFRANILGATKNPLSHVQLNEKNWLLYCSKVWDHVEKSSFFVEYTKLMP